MNKQLKLALLGGAFILVFAFNYAVVMVPPPDDFLDGMAAASSMGLILVLFIAALVREMKK